MQSELRSNNIIKKLAEWDRFLLTSLFFAAYMLVMLRLWWPISLPGKINWPGAVLLVSALACTIAALARHLPLQNVFGAAAVIIFGSGAAEWLNVKIGIPFGPVEFGAVGPKFHSLPWALPIFWTVAILNSRGVARLILRPWRKTKNYGFRLIGLTVALTVFFDFSFEPYATRVKQYWFWAPTKFPVSWQGAPLVNFLSWAVVTGLILAFITPILINKHHTHRRPPDFHPLTIWLAAILLFAVGAVVREMWIVAAVDAVIGIAAAIFAVRGAKW
jgi:Carotenoid biosynthesis protein